MNETNSHEGLHSMSVPGQAKCRINILWRVEEKWVFEQTAYFCLSSLSARQLRYCLYGDCKGARPDHSARPQTTAHLEWSRRVFKLYPLAPILFPPLNSTMPPFSLWAALHEPETSSLHPLPLTPTAKELNTTCQQPKYWKSRCAAVSLDMMLTSRCLVKLNYNRINVSVSLSVY